MKKREQIIALVLLGVLSLSVTACGSSSTSENAENTSISSDKKAESETIQSEATEQSSTSEDDELLESIEESEESSSKEVVELPEVDPDLITFRGMPWYTTQDLVQEKMDNDYLEKDTTRYWDSSMYVIDYYFGTEVAGHEAKDIELYYIYYDNVSVELYQDFLSDPSYIDKPNEFYQAEYNFEPTNPDEADLIYEDLREKLNEKYGHYDDVGNRGVNTSYTEWKDKENNTLTLYCELKSYPEKSSVSLTYRASGATEKIEQLKEMVDDIEEKAKKSEYEGETDGL